MNPKTELRLQEELERLKHHSNLGLRLSVAWEPSSNEPLSGEVKNDVILVYEPDEGKAVDTLHHEFIDYTVSLAIEPYKTVINELIKLLNKNAYKRKEDVVEGLRGLLLDIIDKERT
jgi:hypothetical protein